MKHWPTCMKVAMVALPLSLGCGAETPAGSSDDGGGELPECFSSNECPTGWECSEFGTCLPPMDPPGDTSPPIEVEYDLGRPASSLRYLYVGMPELDAVARIDGLELSVTSLSVGESPREVVTAPGTDTALVVDSINGILSIVRPELNRDSVVSFKSVTGANRVAVNPTGEFAVVWFDLNKAISDAGGLAGVATWGSFQDVTIVDIRPGAEMAVDLSVGFRPKDVAFAAVGTEAYVVTDDGISTVQLTGLEQAAMAPPIAITGDPFLEAELAEIDIVAAGDYAVARAAERAELYVLGLRGDAAGVRTTVSLPGVPSDLDITADGGRVLAVIRETSQLVAIDLTSPTLSANVLNVSTHAIGSVTISPDGQRAALFTNAEASERLTIVDISANGLLQRALPLQKSIRWAAFDPSGDRLFVAHARTYLPAADTFDELVDQSYGYSVVDANTGFAKLQLTTADIGDVAFADGWARAYVTVDGGDEVDATKELHIVDLATGIVEVRALASAPEHVGILPGASKAFVSQRHRLGRVSIIDIASGGIQTITGFDLNSQIVD